MFMVKTLAGAILMSVFLLASHGKPAYAACETDANDDACRAAAMAARAPNYMGPKAPTTKEMVCLHAIADQPTELVLVEGIAPDNVPVQGPQILTWRPNTHQWRRWSRDASVWVREICFPRSYLRSSSGSFRSMTLCNGTELNQPNRGRSRWIAQQGHPQQLWKERRISERNPACLLGRERCARYGL